MIVLLKVDCMYALPVGIDFLSLRLVLGLRAISNLRYVLVTVCFRPATALRLPRFVLALVVVRCPRTGNPRRCRPPLNEPISISRRTFKFTSRLRSPSTFLSLSTKSRILDSWSSVKSLTRGSPNTPAVLSISLA